MKIRPSSLILLLAPFNANSFTPTRYNAGYWRAGTTTISDQWKSLPPKLPVQYTYKISSYLNGISDTGNDEQVTEERVGNLMSTVDELKIDVDEASQRATVAEERVSVIQIQLSNAEKELEEKGTLLEDSDNFWDQEKDKLLGRITDFTNILQIKDRDTEAATDAIKLEAKGRQEILENEIAELKQSLQQAEGVMNEEKKSATEMFSKLLSAEDALEYEQMNYQKLKRDLDKRIIDEKSKLRLVEKEKKDLKLKMEEDLSRLMEVQAQLESEQKDFENEKRKFNKQIQDGIRIRKLKETQMTSRYEKIRKNMTALWVGAKNDASKEKINLTGKITDRDDAIERLEGDLEEARSKNKELSLKREEMKQQKINAMEEQHLMEEKYAASMKESDLTISGLKSEISGLQSGKTEYKLEINDFQEQIQQEGLKRSERETLFENEKNSFEQEKSKLESKIEDSVKKIQRETEIMNDKYDRMRTDMTALLDASKDVAQEEERKMTNKYDGFIAKRNDSISRLEGELSGVELVSSEMSNQLEFVTLQRNNARKDVRRLDINLTERNQLVSELNTQVSERAEIIAEYESSYKKIMKSSVKLTKTRLRNLIRRRRNKENNGM